MSKAPEVIWANPNGDVISIRNGYPDLKTLIAAGRLTKYVRADRIEELEAQNADLKAKLEKAAQCFIKIILHCANFGRGVPSTDKRIIERCEETAANALEYLAGGKDDRNP